jgi:hypothetical protein
MSNSEALRGRRARGGVIKWHMLAVAKSSNKPFVEVIEARQLPSENAQL